MTKLRSIIIKKSSYSHFYNATEPIDYNFYLLILLINHEIAVIEDLFHFLKNSSISCWTTKSLFINKNGRNIELFDILDLANNEELCLPKGPKLVMSKKNILHFLGQWKKLQELAAQQIYIAIDERNTVHLTTDLASIRQTTFLSKLQSYFSAFFRKK